MSAPDPRHACDGARPRRAPFHHLTRCDQRFEGEDAQVARDATSWATEHCVISARTALRHCVGAVDATTCVEYAATMRLIAVGTPSSVIDQIRTARNSQHRRRHLPAAAHRTFGERHAPRRAPARLCVVHGCPMVKCVARSVARTHLTVVETQHPSGQIARGKNS